jgi:single-stranded-DNA-specific exonuclease
LCQRLDQYARARLTLADFDPALELDAQLRFDQITPQLFQAVRQLEPFGVGNREPIFAASNVRLMAPPQIMKDKHVRLKLSFNVQGAQDELTETAVLVTPRCHPDSAAIRRTEKERRENWRRAITYDALGWHMAERAQQTQLLPGDTLDIAFSLDQNDHSDFGGLQLSLRDFKVVHKEGKDSLDTSRLLTDSGG